MLLPTLGNPTRATSAISLSSSSSQRSSPASPCSAKLGARRRLDRKLALPRPPWPPRAACQRSPVCGQVGQQGAVLGPDDRARRDVDDRVLAGPAVLPLAAPVGARCRPGGAGGRGRPAARPRCGRRRATPTPPSPPLPPSGPPRGTWASRRIETAPAPPSPPRTFSCASSTNPDTTAQATDRRTGEHPGQGRFEPTCRETLNSPVCRPMVGGAARPPRPSHPGPGHHLLHTTAPPLPWHRRPGARRRHHRGRHRRARLLPPHLRDDRRLVVPSSATTSSRAAPPPGSAPRRRWPTTPTPTTSAPDGQEEPRRACGGDADPRRGLQGQRLRRPAHHWTARAGPPPLASATSTTASTSRSGSDCLRLRELLGPGRLLVPRHPQDRRPGCQLAPRLRRRLDHGPPRPPHRHRHVQRRTTHHPLRAPDRAQGPMIAHRRRRGRTGPPPLAERGSVRSSSSPSWSPCWPSSPSGRSSSASSGSTPTRAWARRAPALASEPASATSRRPTTTSSPPSGRRWTPSGTLEKLRTGHRLQGRTLDGDPATNCLKRH